MKRDSIYKLQYYEDDVVVYTSSGKHPKLPECKKEHVFRWGGHKHTLKSFYTAQQAEVSMSFAKRHSYPSSEKYVVFYCDKCCMYHITTEKNYRKYLEK